jgi:hypothetical protein
MNINIADWRDPSFELRPPLQLEVIQGEIYRCIYSDRTSYLGTFNSSMLRHGHGVTQDRDGKEVYSGEWKDDFKHGFGRETLSDGSLVSGQWSFGNLNRGERVFPNGDLYSGCFNSELQPHSFGTLCRLDGSLYRGHWQNGTRHGQGKSTCADGQSYEGNWTDGQPFGIGTARLAVHGVIGLYFGQWSKGGRSGQGSMTTPSKCGKYVKRYVGSWKDDLPNGLGTLTVSTRVNDSKIKGHQHQHQHQHRAVRVSRCRSIGGLWQWGVLVRREFTDADLESEGEKEHNKASEFI